MIVPLLSHDRAKKIMIFLILKMDNFELFYTKNPFSGLTLALAYETF